MAVDNSVLRVRREPVPVNDWEPLSTTLEFPAAALELPCFPIPYTRWTSPDGLVAPLATAVAGGGQWDLVGDFRTFTEFVFTQDGSHVVATSKCSLESSHGCSSFAWNSLAFAMSTHSSPHFQSSFSH